MYTHVLRAGNHWRWLLCLFGCSISFCSTNRCYPETLKRQCRLRAPRKTPRTVFRIGKATHEKHLQNMQQSGLETRPETKTRAMIRGIVASELWRANTHYNNVGCGHTPNQQTINNKNLAQVMNPCSDTIPQNR